MPPSGTPSSSDRPPDRLRYEPALDGLRAVAASLVLFHHLEFGGPTGGFIGVPVFFVLSGYLITSLIRDEVAATGKVAFHRFWRRRMYRLYPALILGVILALALALASDNYPHQTVLDSAYSVTYLEDFKNWLGQIDGFSLITNSWSLAVEAQFYLAWPLIVGAALRRRSRRWLTALCLAGAAICLGLSAVVQANLGRSLAGGLTIGTTYDFPLYSVVPLLIGSALSLTIAQFARLSEMRFVVPVAGAILVLEFMRADPNTWLTLFVGLPLVYLAAAGIIGSLVLQRPSALARALSSRPAVWLGRRSYAVYVFHWPISVVARTLAIPARVAVVVGGTLLLAALSWRFVEAPFLRRGGGLRGRLLESETGRPATAHASL